METFRLQYPLDKDSIVLDAGVYHGDFTDWCLTTWGCRVYGFEPTSGFYINVCGRFDGDARVRVFNYGLSGCDETPLITINNDGTSVHLPGPIAERVRLRDVVGVLGELPPIDLFKINIEGCEYSVLNRLLDVDMMRRVRFFQIQFHNFGVTDPKAARAHIRSGLARTHDEQWCVHDGQWESWARR